MDLDISTSYHYYDKKEIKWSFRYQQLANDEGWFVWMTKPGQIEICIGRTTEDEIIQKLKENPPLTIDDRIDLGLWLEHDGLDEYLPKQDIGRD